MTVFITSDTHFSHANILTAGRGRPFRSISEHDNALVDNWNSVVTPADTVIHMGDVAMSHRAESLPIINRLNGKKILIPGNHDYVSATEKASRREKYFSLYKEYFTIWSDCVVIFGRVVLSHFPPAEILDHSDEERYPEMRPALRENAVYLHGHTHQDYTRTILSNGSVAISVGVDANNYTPVSLDNIPELSVTEREWIWQATHS